MKIVIAPDSFKGSITAYKAAEIMEKGVKEVLGECEVITKPMADGGEGTLEAILAATNGTRIPIICMGPLGEEIKTSYGVINQTTAIIECASICGLVLVPEGKRNPDHTTTFGVGEAIKDALDKGYRSIIVGLGGSATNDGGIGMLQALGLEIWDENGHRLGPFGTELKQIAALSMENVDNRLKDTQIKVACDVDNPLCGDKGASYVFGPQKGASSHQVKEYDEALLKYGNLMGKELKKNIKDMPGAGAAGGLGFGFITIGAKLVSGANLIAEAVNLEESIQGSDLVLTGEGKSDIQTLYGKAPGYVASIGWKYGVPTILISGSLSDDIDVIQKRFAGCFSIINKPMSLDECMRNVDGLLLRQTKQVIHFWNKVFVTT